MAFVKKTWTDRMSQYPTRRILTDTTTGTTQTVTVARSEGEVSQTGDAFNASNMNDLENRIEAGINAAHSDADVLLPLTVGWTGKNLLDGYKGNQSSNNVTFTSIDADKSVMVSTNGTASALTTFSKDITAMAVDTTTEYILSGCPAGGLAGGYQLDIIASNITMSSVVDTGDGIKFSFPVVPTGNQKYYIRIRIANGASVNKTFYPMIRLATVADATYEPHHDTVDECKLNNSAVAPVEKTNTASQAYAVDEYFVKDGKLCKAILAITAGGALTKNTNYVETLVANEFGSGGGGSSTNDVFLYKIDTKSTGGQDAAVTVKVYKNNVLQTSTDYLYTVAQTPITIDGRIELDYGVTTALNWTYKLLQASESHAVGYSESWSYAATVSKDETFLVSGSGAKTAFIKATPNMTGYTTPSGVVSASSEYNGSYAAWYAFNGVYGYDQQTWATAANQITGAWIQYLFNSAKVIKKIATVNRNEGNVRAIKTFKFQGSNDGTNFTDLASCEILSGAAAFRQEFTIDNDDEYLYYRLYVTAPWIPNDMTVGLAELELYEEVEVSVAVLDDLVDVEVTNPADKQFLSYNASTSKWENVSGYVRAGQKENTSIGAHATAEGTNNTATGDDAHTEGYNNTASQPHTHAEGEQCQATEWWAHAEGFQSVASGRVSHAEGNGTVSSAYYSHSEGTATHAYGNSSHAEGDWTTASGADSHAQNANTTASGARSSAAGYYTTAGYENQFVIGKYNDNKSTNIFEVGNGTDGNTRSNALELDSSGNLKVAGAITAHNRKVSPVIAGNILSSDYYTLVTDLSADLVDGDILVLTANDNLVFSSNSEYTWYVRYTKVSTGTTAQHEIAGSFSDNIGKGSVLILRYNAGSTPDFTLLAFVEKDFYMEQTVTLSTSATTTVTFSNWRINNGVTSTVEVGISEWGLVPDDVTTTYGSCTVTLPKVDSAHTVTVRLYVR